MRSMEGDTASRDPLLTKAQVPQNSAQPNSTQQPVITAVPLANGDRPFTSITSSDGIAITQPEAAILSPQSTPQTQPRTDLPPTALRQIVEIAEQMPSRPVEITLDPKELGRVRLSVSPTETGIMLSVLAERPETLDLLRRHIAVLGQQFQDLGYDDVAFSFNGGDARHGAHDTETTTGDTAVSDETAQPLSTTVNPIHISPATDGLDLRL
jgi:flagellar hook-length control protein FliK